MPFLDIDHIDSTIQVITSALNTITLTVKDPKTVGRIVQTIRSKLDQIHPDEQARQKLIITSIITFAIGVTIGLSFRSSKRNRGPE